jgi:chemotaxis-related protein WspB
VRRLGLKAEHVAGVADIEAALRDGGVVAAPWLGLVAPGGNTDGAGMLQLIDPERLLAPEVAALLFGEAAA